MEPCGTMWNCVESYGVMDFGSGKRIFIVNIKGSEQRFRQLKIPGFTKDQIGILSCRNRVPKRCAFQCQINVLVKIAKKHKFGIGKHNVSLNAIPPTQKTKLVLSKTWYFELSKSRSKKRYVSQGQNNVFL